MAGEIDGSVLGVDSVAEVELPAVVLRAGALVVTVVRWVISTVRTEGAVVDGGTGSVAVGVVGRSSAHTDPATTITASAAAAAIHSGRSDLRPGRCGLSSSSVSVAVGSVGAGSWIGAAGS